MFSLRQGLTGSANREVCWIWCITSLTVYFTNQFACESIFCQEDSRLPWEFLYVQWLVHVLRLIFILVWASDLLMCILECTSFNALACTLFVIQGPCRLNSDFVLTRLLSGIPVTKFSGLLLGIRKLDLWYILERKGGAFSFSWRWYVCILLR